MLFARLDRLLDGTSSASTLFSGPYYLAEQLGFRKVLDVTFMIATMVTGDPDPQDLQKYFRPCVERSGISTCAPTVTPLSIGTNFPRATIRSWIRAAGGPASALYSRATRKRCDEATFDWIAKRGIFGDMDSDAKRYQDLVVA